MVRIVLISLCLVILAGSVLGQPGSIAPFADRSATNPYLIDTGGLVQVHLFHVNTSGATASQFLLDAPVSWTLLGDVWQFPTIIGTSITGVSLGYGSCLSNWIYLGCVNFFGSCVPECTMLTVVPDPAAPTGMIEGVDCNATKTFPLGGRAVINPNATCYVT